MKRILTHWVEMETLEVPDECPTEDEQAIMDWIEANGGTEIFCVKRNSRDYEIVTVEEIDGNEVD